MDLSNFDSSTATDDTIRPLLLGNDRPPLSEWIKAALFIFGVLLYSVCLFLLGGMVL